MNVEFIKTLCQQIQDRLGGNAAAAKLAGVGCPQWSNYCNSNRGEDTIPLHRFVRVANAAERRMVAEMLLGDAPAEAGDVLGQTVETFVKMGAVAASTQLAVEDGKITPREARDILRTAVDARRSIDRLICTAEALATPPEAAGDRIEQALERVAEFRRGREREGAR